MYLLLGIVVTIIGIVMILCPELVYQVTQSWKNEGNDEPSTLYLWHTRVGGIVFSLVGIVGTVLLIFVS